MKRSKSCFTLRAKRMNSNGIVPNEILKARVNEGLKRFYCAEDREADRMTSVFFGKGKF